MGRFALLVANGDYHDPALASMASPGSDIDALAEVLADPTRGGFDVTTVLDKDEREVRLAVASFAAGRSSNDLLLLYFSCHGVMDESGGLYLATVDTRLSMLQATSVADTFVKDCLDRADASQQILILDCCHSGAFARGSKSAAGASVATGVRFTRQGSGRSVLTASDTTQLAWSDPATSAAEPSLFTKHLVNGLRSGDADADGKGIITVNDAYDYVSRVVPPSKQRPLKFGEPAAGTALLARNPSPKPAALPEDIAAGIADHRPWIRTATVAQLSHLADDRNAGIALAATRALMTLSSTDDSMQVRQAASSALCARPGPEPHVPVAPPIVEESPAVDAPLAMKPRHVTPTPSGGVPVAGGTGYARLDRRNSSRVRMSLLLAIVFVLNWAETYFDTSIRAVVNPLVWGSVSPEDTMARTMTRLETWMGQWLSIDETHQVLTVQDFPSMIGVTGYSVAYFVVFPALALGLLVALARREDRSAYSRFSYAICIDYAISLLCFLVFPVPERWAFPESGTVLLSDLLPYDLGMPLIQHFRTFSALDNSFPSFHVSLTVIVMITAYLERIRVRSLIAALGTMVILSTYFLGVHWLPDMVAGVAVAAFSVLVALRLTGWEKGSPGLGPL